MVSKNWVGNHSQNLLAAVATYREDDDTNKRPIIFVAHSLGGLVCEDVSYSVSFNFVALFMILLGHASIQE